jgi:phosphoribosylanthranilate isomerase
MTLVKICGIKEIEHAIAATEAGASLIGFVFVPVRREVTPEVARTIVTTVRRHHERPPATVGLFVNESAEKINRIVAQVGLDLVQLHGDESPELAADIDVPVIKAIRLDTSQGSQDVQETVAEYAQICAGVLIDSHVPGHWGGTGVVGDWATVAKLAPDFPVILAGGLTADNVGEAIQTARPVAVDVSSGVETDGRKDIQKIERFIAEANAASATVVSRPSSQRLVRLIEKIRERPGSRSESISFHAQTGIK